MRLSWLVCLCDAIFDVQLNFLDDYSVKTDDVEQQVLQNDFCWAWTRFNSSNLQLEKYRIERDVALTAIGHPSLTAVPKHDQSWKREKLMKLKERALSKVCANPVDDCSYL